MLVTCAIRANFTFAAKSLNRIVLSAASDSINLQAAFLSPPVAMSAFYLKGVAPKHVTINQIFAGMMPYMLIVILCMVIMYLWPGMTLWLPNFLYGAG